MLADISTTNGIMSDAITNSFADYVTKENTTGTAPTVGASRSAFTMKKPTVDTYAKANATITAVQDAINKVSSQRSALGALQNRLEHTIANLQIWLLKWLSTARTTFLLRLVSLCWLRVISQLRVYYLCYSSKLRHCVYENYTVLKNKRMKELALLTLLFFKNWWKYERKNKRIREDIKYCFY